MIAVCRSRLQSSAWLSKAPTFLRGLMCEPRNASAVAFLRQLSLPVSGFPAPSPFFRSTNNAFISFVVTRKYSTARSVVSAISEASSMAQVALWAETVLTDANYKDDLDRFKRQKVHGKALFSLTEEKLLQAGLSLGATVELTLAISQLKAPSLSLASPELLRESIHKLATSHPSLKLKLGYDRRCPQKLAEEDFPPDIFLLRGEALTQTFASFAARLGNRKGAKNPTGKDYNPFTALQAPPGSGKSFFLDLVASATELTEKGERLREFAGSTEIKHILKNSLPVTVTYNKGTLYRRVDNLDAESGLAMRCLFSCFFEASEQAWTRFSDSFPAMQQLTLGAALDTIFLVARDLGKNGVLLCIDETLLAAGVDPRPPTGKARIAEILTAVGEQLRVRDSTQFNALFSTLDIYPFRQMRSHALQATTYVVMDPVSQTEAEKLFNVWLSQPKPSRVGDPYWALRACISDCGGHLRSLAALYVACRKGEFTRDMPYSVLRDEARKELQERCVVIPDLLIVQRAICSEDSLDLNERARFVEAPDFPNIRKAPHESHWRDWLSSFTVPVTDPYNAVLIPEVAPSLLMLFSSVKVKQGYHGKLAAAIEDLFSLEPIGTWGQFELWQAHWEQLRRVAFSGSTTSLQQHYSLPSQLSRILPALGKRFILQQKAEGLKYLTGRIETIAQGDTESWGVDDLHSAIFVLPEVNPGFGILVFEKALDGETIALCIDCRTSPSSNTPLSLADVETKHAQTFEIFNPYLEGRVGKADTALGKLRLSKENIILVVAACKGLNSDLAGHQKDLCRRGVVLLDQADLKRLYGPSLWKRPQFLLGV